MEKSKRTTVRVSELVYFVEGGKFKGARFQPIKHKFIPLEPADMRAIAKVFRILADYKDTMANMQEHFDMVNNVRRDSFMRHAVGCSKKAKKSKKLRA
jgi:hypothetical protein